MNELHEKSQHIEGTKEPFFQTLNPEASVFLCTGACLINLPSAKDSKGRILTFKMVEEGLVALFAQRGEQVLDGELFYLRGKYLCVQIVSDGSNWVDPEKVFGQR